MPQVGTHPAEAVGTHLQSHPQQQGLPDGTRREGLLEMLGSKLQCVPPPSLPSSDKGLTCPANHASVTLILHAAGWDFRRMGPMASFSLAISFS